jgi:hypothetical protein
MPRLSATRAIKARRANQNAAAAINQARQDKTSSARLRNLLREVRQAAWTKQEAPGTAIPRASTAPHQIAADGRAARAQSATRFA